MHKKCIQQKKETNGNFVKVIIEENVEKRITDRADTLSELLLLVRDSLKGTADVYTMTAEKKTTVKAAHNLINLKKKKRKKVDVETRVR